MGILDLAKADIEQITSDLDGWARSATFTAPGGEVATVNLLHTKHHFGVDTDGNRVNTKNSHIGVAEKKLTDLSYPVRNAAGEVNLLGHIVVVKDSTGSDCSYVIRENYPDETIGLIVCILGDFE